MKSWHSLILCVGFLLGLSSNAQAQETIDCASNPTRFAKDPFTTPESILAFQNYVARLNLKYDQNITLPNEFFSVAPTITRWGYQLRQDLDGVCQVDFVQTFDFSGTISRLRDEINRFKQDGCSYFSAKDAVANPNGKTITFKASVAGKKRACGDWPWGGEWKTDLGDISGQLWGEMSFRTEPTSDGGKFNGRVVANDPKIEWNVEIESIFGIKTSTLVGKILEGMARLTTSPLMMVIDTQNAPFWAYVNRFDQGYRITGNSILDANFVYGENGSVSSKKYTDFMKEVRKFAWSIQPYFLINDSNTKIYTDTTHKLEVVFSAPLKPLWPPETVWTDAVTEIKLIESFKEKDKTHIVSSGDTLWSIAEKQYGNGFYYHFLDVASADTLKIGQVVTLPPLYSLVPHPYKHIVSPGETATGLCKKWLPDDIKLCLVELSKANRNLRLDRLYALQLLSYPSTASNNF